MVPKPGLPIKHANIGTQTKKKDLIRCKSAMSSINTKQQNAYNNMIDYTTHNMEKKCRRTKRDKL